MVSIINSLSEVNRQSIIKLVLALLCVFVISYLRYYVFIPDTVSEQLIFVSALIFLYKVSTFPIVNRKNWIVYFLGSLLISYVLNFCFYLFLILLMFIPFSIFFQPLAVAIYIGLDFLSNFYILRRISWIIQVSILVFGALAVYFVSLKLHEFSVIQLFQGKALHMDIYYELFIIVLSVLFAPILTTLYLKEHKKRLMVDKSS